MAKAKTKNISKDIHDFKECPECGGVDIIYNDEKQQIICRSCGLIYEPLLEKEEKEFEKAGKL